MLLDAVGYSFGALGPIRAALSPSDAYWSRRLLLNLLLANAGLYLTGFFALAGAYLSGAQPAAARVIMTLSLLSCLYSVLSVPMLTPSDWPHAAPRAVAGLLILVGRMRR